MISNYAANKVLDHLLRTPGTALASIGWSAASGVWLALFTTAIDRQQDIGGPTEVSGGSYTRAPLTFSAAAKGLEVISAAVTFPAPTGNWGTIIAVAVVDTSASSGGGHILWFENVCPFVINNGDPAFSLPAGSIKISLGGELCDC